MRSLTAKQKKLLKQEWHRLQTSGIEYPDVEDIDWDVYIAIRDLHPCEIYYQNVVRFFHDLGIEYLHSMY